MGVKDVELASATRDRFDHERAGRVRVDTRPPETQRARPDRMQFSARPGIATREQGHLMPEIDQLVDQPGHDPFRAAIKLRGNAFGQRSDLGDPHRPPPQLSAALREVAHTSRRRQSRSEPLRPIIRHVRALAGDARKPFS